MTEKRGRGRPPVAPEDRRDLSIRVAVSASELAAIEAWAQRKGRPVSEIARETLILRARKKD